MSSSQAKLENETGAILSAFDRGIVTKKETAQRLLLFLAEREPASMTIKIFRNIDTDLKFAVSLHLEEAIQNGFKPKMIGGKFSEAEIAEMQARLVDVSDLIGEQPEPQ